jgi:23S rRNA pseudouridine1911/1915/1917 synthase
MSAAIHVVAIEAADAGERLDRVLARALEKKTRGLSRTRIAALIAEGRVTREGPAARAGARAGAARLLEPSLRVKPGERYRVAMPEPAPARPRGESIALDIIYEDDHLVVVNKPAGLVVHPAPGNPDRTLVNALIAHCGASLSGIGGEARPGIVHRLDKGTSGLMVAAKTDEAHQGLARQFAAHGRDGKLGRLYLAFTWGALRPAKGTIDAPIGRDPRNRQKFAVVARGGKRAVTHYETRKSYGRPPVASLVACRLETGRTHQIRVHLAHRGNPVIGDLLYKGTGGGGARPPTLSAFAKALGRQALHAAELDFHHPVSGKKMRFSCPLPPDLKALEGILDGL